jgi:hypothetical protein
VAKSLDATYELSSFHSFALLLFFVVVELIFLDFMYLVYLFVARSWMRSSYSSTCDGNCRTTHSFPRKLYRKWNWYNSRDWKCWKESAAN